MSAKLNLYNAIDTALSIISDIKTINIWNSQIDWEEQEHPIQYPAVFIEFSEILYDTQNAPSRNTANGNLKNQQQGICVITLHVVFEYYKTETLSFVDIDAILETINNALLGISGDGLSNCFSSLLRITERQDTDHGAIIDWQVDYSTMLKELAPEDTTLIKFTGTPDVEITKDFDMDDEVIRTGDGKF